MPLPSDLLEFLAISASKYAGTFAPWDVLPESDFSPEEWLELVLVHKELMEADADVQKEFRKRGAEFEKQVGR